MPPEILDAITAWVTDTCRALATSPEAVQVRSALERGQTLIVIEIIPGADNARRIIGQDGQAIRAIRALVTRMTRLQVSVVVTTPQDAGRAVLHDTTGGR